MFAIERGRAGEKSAYVRVHDGELRTRDRTEHGTVTALDVVGVAGTATAGPGDIAKVRGLAEIRVGDRFGRVGSEQSADVAGDFAAPSSRPWFGRLTAMRRVCMPHWSRWPTRIR